MKLTEEQLNKEAFNIDKSVDEMKDLESKIYFKLGEAFCKLESLGWQRQGDHILSYKEYATEKGLKQSFVYGSMRVNKIFGEFRKDKIPPYRRLFQALPLAKDKRSAKEWFDKALYMIPNDFYDELRIAKGKPSQDDCEHKLIETKIIKRCKVCKKVLGYEIKKG